MGTFMASVAFRCSDKTVWQQVKPKIEEMILGIDGLVSNIESDGPGYAIVSPYGDMGRFLADLPERITEITGDYAVMAVCVDSDFSMMELYHGGKLLEECSIGEVYEEYEEFCSMNKPDINLWAALLPDQGDIEVLSNALYGNEVFVEDQLRVISRVTGLPIFDDEMVYDAL